jgi:hypothetical protein|tara:strand:+ start:1127 stop:1309 length:183 start_codon:yes stop_codon:yes gene_type:complete
MTREEFIEWYKKPVTTIEHLMNPELIKLETFIHCKDNLFKYGKGHEDLWYPDYLIWKLEQ